MKFSQHELANGMQVVVEENRSAHSVAFGFFVRAGSRDETDAESGVSHFLEHMVFKGAGDLTAADVNRRFDDVGANYNAATGEESTMFYAAVLPEYVESTLALQARILFPDLRVDDFATEQQVVLEEIGMYEDQPSSVAYDAAMQAHFADHPLGRRILGSVASVSALTPEVMRAYHARRYLAGNMTLAIAGNIDGAAAIELAKRVCGDWPAGNPDRPHRPSRTAPVLQQIQRERLQMMQSCSFTAAPPGDHPLRFAADLLAAIVGDDSNSRLFWTLVDPGLADAAEMGYSDFEDAGALMTFLSCDPDAAAENLSRMESVFDDVNRHGVTAAELDQARTKAATRIVVRGERPLGRLSSLGGNWLHRREYRSVADDRAALEQVTLADIRRLLDDYPLSLSATAIVSPLNDVAWRPRLK